MSSDIIRLREQTDELAALVSTQLSTIASERTPAALYEPIQYVFSKGGKRFRPVLALMAARVFDIDTDRAMPMALAVELVHEFSLIHDDIMDHADSRRGRPTIHVKYDTDTAILCGDALLNLAMSKMADLQIGDLREHVCCLTNAIAALCEGQALDKFYETHSDVTTEDYLHMVDLKTGALIAACLELAGIAANLGRNEIQSLRLAGLSMGRAFQIKDDLLDLVAEDARWGKVIGGDLMEGKKTYLLLEAQSRSAKSDGAFFRGIHQGAGLRRDQITEARQRMDALGVLSASRESVTQHTHQALAHLDAVPGNTNDIQRLVGELANRAW